MHNDLDSNLEVFLFNLSESKFALSVLSSVRSSNNRSDHCIADI